MRASSKCFIFTIINKMMPLFKVGEATPTISHRFEVWIRDGPLLHSKRVNNYSDFPSVF
jgi:hypothetical protein